MHDLFTKHGIYFCKSCPDTQQQNGVAEHKHRHILEMSRSFLIDTFMPYFWLDTTDTVVHNNNYNNTSHCGSRFHEVWGDPDVGNLTSTGIPARRETDPKRLTK